MILPCLIFITKKSFLYDLCVYVFFTLSVYTYICFNMLESSLLFYKNYDYSECFLILSFIRTHTHLWKFC